MVVNQNVNAYRNAFETMDKMKQVVMLYETAIASLQQAKEAINQKDIQERYNKLEKAYLIMSGLRDCLNFQTGGEVAQALKEWYTGTAMRIISINESEDLDMCDLCIDNVKQMRAAWISADMDSKDSGESQEAKEETSVDTSSDDESSLTETLEVSQADNDDEDYTVSAFTQPAIDPFESSERISALSISI